MNPKAVDQRERTRMGRLTQNGRFTRAVRNYKKGKAAEKVRVYEKLFDGVWSFKGLFDLIDYGYVKQKVRHVFKFTLRLSSVESTPPHISVGNRTRVIPTHIKKVVWQRDRGRCVVCGARDELHFDHDIPFSNGGSSVSADNVRILCARHNLEKGNKIE